MGTEKHEAKKRELLESAFATWGKCRYQKTSLSELASAHGMTKQAIYRYYPSKEKLEQAMEESALEAYETSAASLLEKLSEGPADRFAEIFINNNIEFLRQKGFYMSFLAYRYRQSDLGPIGTQKLMNTFTDLAIEKAGIPGIGMRYLNALTVIEIHRRENDGWKDIWENGFSTGRLQQNPDFDRLLRDASRIDYAMFGEDPLIRAVFETVMEEAGNGVSLGKVARKAGLTKSSLYNYWPSKEAMLQDVLGRQISVFGRLFKEFSNQYTDPANRLFAYLAFTGTFFRRTPEILNYMQRVMSSGIEMPQGMGVMDQGLTDPLNTVIDAGLLNLRGYAPGELLGLLNLSTVNEIKHHLTEDSARIHIDQCLKDLYLLIMGGINALRRTM